MKYNGWDKEYLEHKEDYHRIFDQAMVKEVEGDTTELEQTIADYTGRQYAVAVNSASDALYFSLHEFNPGDEVLVTDFSWISTSSCITLAGLTPVFCDIDLDSYHVSFDSIKKMKSDKTKALIYTHLFGNMTDTTEIEKWCKENNIKLIEDSAQSLGSSLNGRKAGTIGDCSHYSFNGNKVIAGISGGGMFLTDNEEMANHVKHGRRHGKNRGEFQYLGINSKMFITNADVIQYRLKYMDEWQKRRNELASIYEENLSDDVIVQTVPDNLEHNFHKYVIRFDSKDQRKAVKDALKVACGFNANVHYEKPLSTNLMYESIDHRKDDCKNSQLAANTVMSLPINAWLKDEEVEKICTTILMA